MAYKSESEAYRASGVDITEGYRAVELMKKHIKRTQTPGVLSPIGGFGGLFAPDMKGMKEPVLVSGTDGVGTKLKLAFLLDRHDTVGIDCVAMCANDIVCCGASPLFFLDYIACGKLSAERAEQIVKGISDGCVQAGAALIGGETAEMPGFYPQDEYDLAGFCVGMGDREKLIDPAGVSDGDVIIALASSGVHSNGFSLVRKLYDEKALMSPDPDFSGRLPAEVLITPTRIYVKSILSLISQVPVKGISHITGGGFFENIPRSIPEGYGAVIDKSAVKILPVFEILQRRGGISERDMFNTYNMGVGMTVITSPADADRALQILREDGEDAYAIGRVAKGAERLELC
ncbi:MAG: phosphoribosylformylglycinamidine cyclo-ligase [Eubacteriaceae bacterium]|nr:phosphoribosylformylglycinamidine cyclo-ligase [Eubacteriaceae bacterium]